MLGITIASRQLYKGIKSYSESLNDDERILAVDRIAKGSLGLAAFVALFSSAITAVAWSGGAINADMRTIVIRIELTLGLIFFTGLVAIPELTNHRLARRMRERIRSEEKEKAQRDTGRVK